MKLPQAGRNPVKETRFPGLIPELVQQGADVWVECDPRLVPLYGCSFPGTTCLPAAVAFPASPVGLAWFSKSPHYAEQKSMTLNELEPVLGIPGITFVYLQYGDTGKERAAFTARTGIEILHDEDVDQMAEVDAFAAQVAALDAVGTISNTTAHMAGGLGVETLLMFDTLPIWYWQMDRPDSPWYPSLRLYRQRRLGEWAEVIGRVGEVVKEILAGRR